MKNITEIIDPLTEAIVVVIDNEDGTFTSMLKSTWEAQEAAKKASGTLS